MPEGGVSGPGLAIAAAGIVLIWSGIQNRTTVESLRALALGQPITPGPQTQSNLAGTGASGGAVAASARAGAIVAQAAALKGTPYLFGGGHRKLCASALDCSGYVSCVLSRVGALKGGSLTTEGLAAWGTGVPFASRQPGDVLVWRGGPGGGHCGIVLDGKRMWHTPCTGCGGVQVGSYGATRSGRPTLVRRAAGG